jgi:DegV family protein with EDD domain
MNKIGLVVDEGADLPQEIIEKHQMVVVPVKMDWPDLESLPGENTFQKMREAEKRGIKSFGKTSQPSPKDFLDAFKKQLERFEKIICITLTSKLSGTYNSANQARGILREEDQKRVFIVDSLNASCAEALSDLKAVDLIEQGKDIEEIVKELEEFIPQVRLYGMFEDPKWLEASGRISSAIANWFRRMQKIGVRPILGIKKGVMKPIGIKAGAKDIPTALFYQFKAKTKKLRNQGKKIRVAITHGDDLDGAQRLKEMIEKELENTEVAFINLIDNVLGVLVGPNAMILAWSEIA